MILTSNSSDISRRTCRSCATSKKWSLVRAPRNMLARRALVLASISEAKSKVGNALTIDAAATLVFRRFASLIKATALVTASTSNEDNSTITCEP